MSQPAIPPEDSAPRSTRDLLVAGGIVCTVAVVLHWVGLETSHIVELIVLILSTRRSPDSSSEPPDIEDRESDDQHP
jgi:hypothetical protein